jgi:hypothetical protein
LIFFKRFGEVSREIERHEHRLNQVSTLLTPVTTKEKVLNSVGVSRQIAHQYEKLAAIPEEKFERAKMEHLH